VKLNSREAPNELRRRVIATGVLVLAVFVALGYRLYTLQVAEGERWASLSENNRVRLQRIPPTRGRIADANGEPLVDNRPSYDVVVVPEDTDDLAATIRLASDFLATEPPDVAALVKAARKRPPYEGLIVQRDVPFDAVVKFETHELDLPGISLEVGPLRTYPFGPVASHLLGYVGEVSGAELEEDSRYRMGDLIGKFGAEKSFESWLRGDPGGRQIEVDSLGRRQRTLTQAPEAQGNSLVLTFDRRLQQFAEQLMADHFGSLVALRPGTGEILAMVSQPGFDPNVFARGIRAREWNGLLSAPTKPLNNRAIQGQYPPGSTFKIVTAAAALEEGVVTPFTRIHCGGSYWFAGRSYRCWRPGGHGSMNLHDALTQSCDVYFYQVGQRLGVDTIAEYANRLGLGLPTGILLDHEKPGLIPTSAWKKRRFNEQWYAGETLSVAIGQGYVLTTPLQMANLIATVANGGTRYRPRFVKTVENNAGEVVEEFSPEPMGEVGFKRSTLHQIRDALRDVVNSPRGTGKLARLPSIEVAGKTGTSQVFKMGRKVVKTQGMPRHLRDHAWFVAFAPLEDPEIAIAVLVEHAGGGGGKMAAPIAHDLADFYFAMTRGRAYQLAGDAPQRDPRVASVHE
jgi:penicillin-binding protein 2